MFAGISNREEEIQVLVTSMGWRNKKRRPVNKSPGPLYTRGFHRRTSALERDPRSLCNHSTATATGTVTLSVAAVTTTAAGDQERREGLLSPVCQASSLGEPALGQVAKESRNLISGAPTLAMTQKHPNVAINS